MAAILSNAKSRTEARKYDQTGTNPALPKYWPQIERVSVSAPLDLYLLIARLAGDPTLWFVQADPGVPNEAGYYRRTLKQHPKVKKDPSKGTDPPGLICPAKAELLIFDLDEGGWPSGCGPETSPADVADRLVDRLFATLGRPRPAAVVAFSGNHIFKGCRAKVLVIPDQPVPWDTVAGYYARAASDPMLLNTAQPCYVAPPVLPPGMVDPLQSTGRVFLVAGKSDTMDTSPRDGDTTVRTWVALHRARRVLEAVEAGAPRHPVVNRLAFQAAGVAAGEKTPMNIVVDFLTDILSRLDVFAGRDFRDEVERGVEDGYAEPINPLPRDLAITKEGDVKSNLSNAAILLSKEINLVETDFGDVEIVKPPPWDVQGTNYPIRVEEYQLRCATAWLQHSTGVSFRKADVSDAIGMLSGARKINRLIEYLEACEELPLGRLTLDNAAHVGWGAKDTPAHRLAVRRYLIQCVHRAFDPGCTGELCLVLHAKPGSGKGRSAWQMFTRPGERYFTSSHISIGNQAQYAPVLRGLWGAELGEQRSVSAWHQDVFKSFISQRKITMRLPYERLATEIPLRVNYVWTTELDTPITDDNWRRFLVIEVGKWCEMSGDEIDKLWGEAVRAYRAGERAYLDEEDEAVLRPARELAYAVDSLESHVEEILHTAPLEGDKRAIDTVIKQLSMRQHFGVKVSDAAITLRVGKIMKRLGWVNAPAWGDGKTYREYRPPADWVFNSYDTADVTDYTTKY